MNNFFLKGSTFNRNDAKAQQMLNDLAYIFSSKILVTTLMFPWVRWVNGSNIIVYLLLG